jgi:uncharacterized protein YvpB
MSKKIKIIVIAVTSLLLIGAGIFAVPKAVNKYELIKIEKENEKTLETVQKELQTAGQTEQGSALANEPIEPTSTKSPESSALLSVPFICQAPLQTEENWKYHEESCEEAAVLQAYLYETGQTMTKQQANEEILKMIEWEKGFFGEHRDIYADDVKKLINGYYEIPMDKIEIVYKATLENIKNFVSQGHPVIVPIMGNILKNPYYPYPGYHMLTVIGFTEDKIITNDNGTRHGEKYSYNNDIFLEAMTAAGGDIVVIKTKTTNF